MTRTRVRIKWLVGSPRVERKDLQKELDFKGKKKKGDLRERAVVWSGVVSTSTRNTTQKILPKSSSAISDFRYRNLQFLCCKNYSIEHAFTSGHLKVRHIGYCIQYYSIVTP